MGTRAAAPWPLQHRCTDRIPRQHHPRPVPAAPYGLNDPGLLVSIDMKPRPVLLVVFLGLLARPLAGQDAQLYGTACDGGALLSCNVLGLLYETGAGGTRDLARAIALYQRACDGGVMAGCTRLQLSRQSGADVALTDEVLRIGRVADAETGEPVRDASVELPGVGLRVISNESGRVELGRLERGRYRIVAERAGYRTLEGELPVPWDAEFLFLLSRRSAPEPLGLGRIYGRVTDEGGVDGLSDVDVTVMIPTPARTLSNPQGRFALTGLQPNEVEVRFSRLGYAPRTTTVRLEPGKTMEVHVSMTTRPIELEPIVVTVGSGYLDRSGFFRRARYAGGSRFTGRDVERLQAQVVSDLVTRVPGVTVQIGQRGTEIVTRRRLDTGDGGPCYLRLYLDGIPMFDWDLDLVRPEDIDGLEVYQGLGAPAEYRNLVDPDGTFPCGVVLIWTRRGR